MDTPWGAGACLRTFPEPKKDNRRCHRAAGTDLQGIDQLPVLLAGEEQGRDAGIRQLQHSLPELWGCPRGLIAEENGHFPHQKSIPHSLERVSGHEGHGSLQALLLGCQSHLKVLDPVQEDGLLLGVGKPDLRGHLVVIGDHRHAGPPRAVALGNGQVAHDFQEHVPHSAKGILGDPLRGVQSKGQFRGEHGALQGPWEGGGFQRQTLLTGRGVFFPRRKSHHPNELTIAASYKGNRERESHSTM